VAGSRRFFARRFIATLVVLGFVGGEVGQAEAAPPPEQDKPTTADWWDDLSPSTPDDDPVAPPVKEAKSARPIEDEPLAAADDAAVKLPDAGTAELTLGKRGQSRQAGDLPLQLAPKSTAGPGQPVQVEVLDHKLAARAGVKGFAFRVGGEGGRELAPSGGAKLPAKIAVDYSSFKDRYGAGYGDRLQVLALPECALADPVSAGCNRLGRRLPTKNDHDKHRLTVDVPDLAAVQGESLDAPTRESGNSVVLAVTAGPEGEGGSFKASPLSVSGDWQVGIGSGEFTWKYDLPLLEAPAGPTPQISMNYSSGAIDGMVSSRNTQGGALGTGGATSPARSSSGVTTRASTTARRPTRICAGRTTTRRSR